MCRNDVCSSVGKPPPGNRAHVYPGAGVGEPKCVRVASATGSFRLADHEGIGKLSRNSILGKNVAERRCGLCGTRLGFIHFSTEFTKVVFFSSAANTMTSSGVTRSESMSPWAVGTARLLPVSGMSPAVAS